MSSNEKALELKGIGMLEAHGISTEVLPNLAGKDFYFMMNEYKHSVGEYTKEDVDDFLRRIRMYQTGHGSSGWRNPPTSGVPPWAVGIWRSLRVVPAWRTWP